jgi:hypothetical protein
MKWIVLLLVITISTFSCKDDDHGPGSPLKGCCGNEAIDTDVGNGHIYIPNIFTPNGDGLNDFLYIATDSIQLIVEVEIKNSDNTIVFESFDYVINANDWDGRIDGVVVEGIYTVKVSVLADDGSSHTVEGKVCNFSCDSDHVTEQVPRENCQFPSQVDNGHFCPACPSGESDDCFE